MHDLNDLYYFAKVVEHGGFAAAGRALGEPKSKLSRRVALLEERLGVRLIQRSTRRFSVTEAGQTFYSHVQAMLVEAEAATEAIELTRSQPRGTVRLSCPTTLLDFGVGRMLSGFMATCPDVQLQLEATNRRVDVIAEGLDLAIRVRPPPLQDIADEDQQRIDETEIERQGLHDQRRAEIGAEHDRKGRHQGHQAACREGRNHHGGRRTALQRHGDERTAHDGGKPVIEAGCQCLPQGWAEAGHDARADQPDAP